MNDFITIFGYILAPITGIITWIVGHKKRRNDFLNDLQASINLLAVENKKLMAEIVELRKENARLQADVDELNRKLSNVKTITCTK